MKDQKKLKALGKTVVLRPITPKESNELFQSNQGKSKETYQEADVLDAGIGCEEVKKGWRVLYNQHSGHKQILDGETVVIVQESACVVRLDSDE